jgi:hypothetical protein
MAIAPAFRMNKVAPHTQATMYKRESEMAELLVVVENSARDAFVSEMGPDARLIGGLTEETTTTLVFEFDERPDDLGEKMKDAVQAIYVHRIAPAGAFWCHDFTYSHKSGNTASVPLEGTIGGFRDGTCLDDDIEVRNRKPTPAIQITKHQNDILECAARLEDLINASEDMLQDILDKNTHFSSVQLSQVLLEALIAKQSKDYEMMA